MRPVVQKLRYHREIKTTVPRNTYSPDDITRRREKGISNARFSAREKFPSIQATTETVRRRCSEKAYSTKV